MNFQRALRSVIHSLAATAGSVRIAVMLVILSILSMDAGAHSPDVSTVMIFERDHKLMVLIKSSLTALEGEIDYHYKKGAYKTPQEFIDLVTRYFNNNFSIVINSRTIQLLHTHVQLGHETTIVAELANVPTTIKSCYVKNELFKDVSNHQSELIIAAGGLPQKQAILYHGNNNELTLHIENKTWVIDSPARFSFARSSLIAMAAVALLLVAVALRSYYKISKSVSVHNHLT